MTRWEETDRSRAAALPTRPPIGPIPADGRMGL